MRGLRAALLAGACGAFAACGGGGASSVPSAANGAPVGTTFAVTVAAASSVSRLGIASSAEAGSPEHSIAVAPGSPGCTPTGTMRTCTATFSLPSGAQTLTVAAYGATTVRSTVKTTLSGQRVTLAVGTSISEISLVLAATTLAGGASGTTTLYVSAYDASGNTIVGGFANPIALSENDTTGSIALSASSVTAGGTNVTVSYNGSGSLTSVTFNATSTGVAANSIVPATLSFTASQLMYMTSGSSILVFPQNASGDQIPLQRISINGETFVGGAAPNGHGSIWSAAFDQSVPSTVGPGSVFGGRMFSVPAAANGPTAPAFLPASSQPANSVVTDFGVDGAGNLYVLYVNSAVAFSVSVFPPGAQTASTTIVPPVLQNQNVSYCEGIAVAGDGTFAINCSDATNTNAEIFVFAAGASGAAVPVRTITGPATTLHANSIEFGYSYLAFGSDGSLATNDVNTTISGSSVVGGDAAIDVFAPGATGNVAPVRRIAGPGTGLDIASFGAHQFASVGAVSLGIDPTGATDVTQYGSQSGITGTQMLRFAAGANGAVQPVSVLAGPLSGLGGSTASAIHFSAGVVQPAAPSAPQTVTGDFLGFALNRGWNYALNPAPSLFQTPPPASTLSLYGNPDSSVTGGSIEMLTFSVPGTVPTALGASGSVLGAEALFYQGAGGGWFASGYVPISSGASLGGFVPIPGDGIKLVPGSLTVGQTFVPYLGITGTVLSVGSVPGATACPGGAANGAVVAYAFGYSTETIGYVPGCGITYMVTDNGTTAVLTSVGTYDLGTLSAARTPLSSDRISALRSLWRSMFTPWSPK
jgi:YD repeat-containing protein